MDAPLKFEPTEKKVKSEYYRRMGSSDTDVLIMESAKAYACGDLYVLVNCEPTPHGPLYHLSISHPKRYPTWDEISAARNQLLSPNKDYMMMLPKAQHYVNLHQNCFHLWECPKAWNVI